MHGIPSYLDHVKIVWNLADLGIEVGTSSRRGAR